MKYEMIFGDEGLFDCASDDAVLAIKDTTSGRIHIFTNDGWIKSGLKHERHIGTSDNQIAMRRIIKVPTWSVADKKAGKMPEVGCRVDTFIGECTVIGVDLNLRLVGVQYQDDGGMGLLSLDEIKPIESPEEKAVRLREEWCIKALSSCSILSGMKKYDLKRLGGYIGNIYDALLSGELTAPGGE